MTDQPEVMDSLTWIGGGALKNRKDDLYETPQIAR